jgi:hypothetical protein
MMMNKVKHCTENTACHRYCSNKHSLCSVCAHRHYWLYLRYERSGQLLSTSKTVGEWCLPCIIAYYFVLKKTQARTGSRTYTEYSPVSKVTGYSKDDHHSITESDWSEKLTVYFNLVSWSRMNGVLSPGPIYCSTARCLVTRATFLTLHMYLIILH